MAFTLVQTKGALIGLAQGGTGPIFNNDNASGVSSGDLLVASICTDSDVASVSDNVNGAWTEIDQITFTGNYETSLWYRPRSAAVGINSLTVTVGLISGGGLATMLCYNFGGNPDGSINHVGLNQDTGTSALTASANNDTSGNLLLVAGGSHRAASPVTSTAATGDASVTLDRTQAVSGLATNTAYNLNDTNTGSRSGGVTLSNTADWGAILVFFNLTAPAATTATRASDLQKRKVKPIRPRPVTLVAPLTPTVSATRSQAIQKRKVKPLQPRPVFRSVALFTPGTVSTRTVVRQKRVLRPLGIRTRSFAAPFGPKFPLCESLTDGLVTNPILFDRLCN